VRIGEANNLSGVTGVGENFLISGEAGVKNDFAAAARDRAGRAAVKYAPVFEGENCRSVRNFRQCVLPNASADIVRSFRFRFRGRRYGKRPEMIDRPISKYCAAVNEAAGHRTENARIVGADAVIAHHEIVVTWHAQRTEIAEVLVLRRHVGSASGSPSTYTIPWRISTTSPGRPTTRLMKDLVRSSGYPEDDHVAALDGLKAINKFVDEDAFLVGEQRGHAGAFDFYRLIEEDDDDQRQANGDEQIARPNTNFSA